MTTIITAIYIHLPLRYRLVVQQWMVHGDLNHLKGWVPYSCGYYALTLNQLTHTIGFTWLSGELEVIARRSQRNLSRTHDLYFNMAIFFAKVKANLKILLRSIKQGSVVILRFFGLYSRYAFGAILVLQQRGWSMSGGGPCKFSKHLWNDEHVGWWRVISRQVVRIPTATLKHLLGWFLSWLTSSYINHTKSNVCNFQC